MKKKKRIYVILAIITLGILLFIFIKSNSSHKGIIHITAGNIDFSKPIVSEQIKQELDSKYQIDSESNSSNKEDEAKAIDFANKITFLLLGSPGEGQVDYLEYKKREEEFNKLVAEDAVRSIYQRSGIRYKMTKAPEDMRKILRNIIVSYNDYGKATVINFGNDIVEVKVILDKVVVVSPDSNNPQQVTYRDTKMELRYYLRNIYGEYRLKQIKYRTGDDLVSDVEDAEQNELKNLNQSIVSKNGVDTKYNDEYNFSKLENLTNEKQDEIYNQNVDNVVILQADSGISVINTATGVLVSDGYVVTTWNFFEKSLADAQFITVRDKDGKSYELDGIVSIDTNQDIVVLKLKNKKESTIKIGNSTNMQKEDAILSIGTKTGYKLSVTIGIVAENKNNTMKNILSLTSTDEGSPVFNEAGELIAINTSQSVDSSISVANSINSLKALKEKLDKEEFSNVKSISFEKLKEKFYYNKSNDEVIVNQVSKNVWNEYKQIGNLENNISLKLNKASYYNGIISLRYENEISEYMSGMARAYKFVAELKKSGYETVCESTEKCVYKNNEYKVTVMDQLGYLIIIMTKI